MKKKQSITPQELCKDLPIGIADFTAYIRNMKVYEDPDYNLLRNKLAQIGKDEGLNISPDESVRVQTYHFNHAYIEKYVYMEI